MNETIELKIKDGEGRLWTIKTDATREIVYQAIKLLRELDNRRMCELENIITMYNFDFDGRIVEQLVDFEM